VTFAVTLADYELPIVVWRNEERGSDDDKGSIGNYHHEHPITRVEEEDGDQTSLERGLAILETRLPKLCNGPDARTTRVLKR